METTAPDAPSATHLATSQLGHLDHLSALPFVGDPAIEPNEPLVDHLAESLIDDPVVEPAAPPAMALAARPNSTRIPPDPPYRVIQQCHSIPEKRTHSKLIRNSGIFAARSATVENSLSNWRVDRSADR